MNCLIVIIVHFAQRKTNNDHFHIYFKLEILLMNIRLINSVFYTLFCFVIMYTDTLAYIHIIQKNMIR